MPDQVQYVQYGAGHTLLTSHVQTKRRIKKPRKRQRQRQQKVQYGAGHTLLTSQALQKGKEEHVKTLSEVGYI